jgi:MYXO-CTERM domain-containing protein
VKWTTPLLSVLSLLTFDATANATPNFPPEVARHLSLPAPPDCSLCHHDGITGLGTVTTPFGTSMRAQGLVPFDTASLDSALDALDQAKVDSDGDCVPDIDELKAGTNPDVPDNPDGGACADESAAAANAPPPPVYGCQLRVAPDEPPATAGLWALGAAALALVSRLRRRASGAL